MATATASVATDEILTMEEIKKRFDSEWVLIANPKKDAQLNVLGGEVVYHHPDRIVFDREVLQLNPHPKNFAVLFIGQPANDLIYLI